MKSANEPVQEIEALRDLGNSDDIPRVLKTVRTADRAGAWPRHGTRAVAPDLNPFQTGSYVQPARITAAPVALLRHRRRSLSGDV